MEGEISWTVLIASVFFVGLVWYLVRDDKKPKKSSQTIVQDITVNVKLDKESIELLADAIKKKEG